MTGNLDSCATTCSRVFSRMTEATDVETLNHRLVSVIASLNPCTCVDLYEGRYREDDDHNRLLISTHCSRRSFCTHHNQQPTVIPLRRQHWETPVATLVLILPVNQKLHPFTEVLPEVYLNLLDHVDRATRDTLTHLKTRRAFNAQFERIYRQGRRSNDLSAGYTLAVIDVDHFKRVNDQFGHNAGDKTLQKLAELMVKCFRDEDRFYRFGGEEFVVVLNGVTDLAALSILERFRKMVADQPFPEVGHITVTIGVTHVDTDQTLDVLLEQADRALYHGKQTGRNRTRLYHQLVAVEEITPLNEAN